MTKTNPLPLETDKPRLIVTVDTEEQFDWSKPIAANDHSVNDPEDLKGFHEICMNAGASPIYFLSFPLLADERWQSFMRSIADRGEAEPGLHLHQWVTPPETDHRSEYYSYQTNLPTDIHLSKLNVLAGKFEDVFGRRARAHRAGRYGIGENDYALLAQVGVTHDFSPGAAFDFSGRGGPDFSSASNFPFVIDAGENHKIFVTPVCGARAIPRTRRFLSQETASPGFSAEPLGIVARHSQPLRLSPEGAKLDDLKALTQKLLKDETPVLSFTLHSTTLTPGANDYAKTCDDVENIKVMTRAYLSYFRDELGGELLSFSDLDRVYTN